MKTFATIILLPFLAAAIGNNPPLEPRQADPSALLTTCLSLVTACPPTIASCATSFCNACAIIGGPTIGACCSQTGRQNQCFATAFGGAAATTTDSASATGIGSITSVIGVSSPTITSGTLRTSGISSALVSNISNTISANPASITCQGFFQAVSSCASRTPGFTNLGDAAQASCLCYTNGVFAPTPFDNYARACVTYYSSVQPTAVSAFRVLTTFCDDYAPTASTRSTSSGGGIVGGITGTSGLPATSISAATITPSTSTRPTGAAVQGTAEKQSILGMLFLGLAALI